jgi:hypothetical protein
MEKMCCFDRGKDVLDKRVWEQDYAEWLREDEPPEDVTERVKSLWREYGKHGFMDAACWDKELRDKLDFEMIHSISNFGKVPNPSIILCLEGLKMAFDQLAENENKGELLPT